VQKKSRELDVSSPPSGASPVAWRRPAAMVLRRKGALEHLALDPQWKRLEDAGDQWRRHPGTRLLFNLLF
jgi:hypothetical protein